MTLICWRISTNENNRRIEPWRDAVLVEEVDDLSAVTALVCALYRGDDQAANAALIAAAPEIFEALQGALATLEMRTGNLPPHREKRRRETAMMVRRALWKVRQPPFSPDAG